jgi:hypothetical protein
MSDEQDPAIRRLFAEQEKSRSSDDFMLRLGKRIDARERARRVYGILATAACVILAILSAPWLAQMTSKLIELAAVGIDTAGPLLHVPLTWLLLGATAAGWSPVIYLWRTGRW